MTDYISFLELGLSADSDYADRIEELHRLTFLSNSDAHSPWTNKLAREFTQFDMPELTFDGLKKAILREQGYKATLNVGFFPEEGKYNKSACIKCFTQYPLPEAVENKWRCTICGGVIKKGVFDRINELADFDEPRHPDHRPPYLHLIPLAEIIQMALGHASVQTKGVQTAWNKLIERFGNEVKALIYSEPEDLKIVGDDRIVNAILAFRKGDVIIHPGGGGQYGWLELSENLKEENRYIGQLSFGDLENIKSEIKNEPKKKSESGKKGDENPQKGTGKTKKEETKKEETEKEGKNNKEQDDDAVQRSLFDF